MTSPLKSQVVSLELSKRLQELGVKQKSLFYWIEYDEKDWRLAYEGEMDDFFKGKGSDWIHEALLRNDGRIFSAFLVGELGEMLPKDININWSSGNDCAGRPGVEANTEYFCTSEAYDCTAETEADARAKMLIHLLENNLLKASDL